MAILSFLFNWPSTAGGIVQTIELARFLAQAGYPVQHCMRPADHVLDVLSTLQGSPEPLEVSHV